MLCTFAFFRMDCIEKRRSCLHSSEMPVVILSVSITIPKKVGWEDGPSIFEALIGALILYKATTWLGGYLSIQLSQESLQ